LIFNAYSQAWGMSETEPPNSGSPPRSKTSGLASWSLALGILSLPCFSIFALIVGISGYLNKFAICISLPCLSSFAALPAVICGHKALKRIKYSGGALIGRRLAVGGLVTGYLGILFAIILIPQMPEAIRVSQRNSCIGRLMLIDAAKYQWALENKKQPTDTPTWQDLRIYCGHGTNGELPTCPGGGVYTIGAVGQKPTCSIPGHHLY
jgi:hypothetical protein